MPSSRRMAHFIFIITHDPNPIFFSAMKNSPLQMMGLIGFLLAAAALVSPAAKAQDQTPTVSPVYTQGLPFTLTMQTVDMGSNGPIALQSYAYASYQGNFVVVDGRTSGLHNFTTNGLTNFPPEQQNEEILVINPKTQQTWSRSLTNSDLSPSEISALSATAPEFAEKGSTLYIAGGYLYASNNFTTYPTLTALDLPGVIDWVTNAGTNLSASVRQTTNSAVQVTGGSLNFVNGTAFLTFGQNFEGPYTPGSDGIYTKQIRTFTIVDTNGSLNITNLASSTPEAPYRRRDLNIVPMTGTGAPALVALSGVFTVQGGDWTVPVEISSNGVPSMANPSAPGTFKQAMNNYHCPTINLYSPSLNQNAIVLTGGISLQTFNGNRFVTDQEDPFTSQSTLVIRDAAGKYKQYYLGDLYPNITDPNTGTPWLFGASAEFLTNPDLPLTNGMINMDALTPGTNLGYIYGGIAAEVPNDGNSTASSELFAVTYNPIQPPAQVITFPPIPSKTYGDKPFALKASSSSKLPVSYSVVSGPATISNTNLVTLTGSGLVTIQADQAGDATYSAATSVTQTFAVASAPQKITFIQPSTRVYSQGDTFTLAATAPGGAVDFTSLNTNVISVSGNTATINGAGNVILTAQQSGSTNYATAVPVSKTATVTKAAQSITFTPTTPVPFVSGNTFLLTATTPSGLSVSFTSSNPKVISLYGSVATINSKGTTVLTATQIGSTNWKPAPPVSRAVKVE